MACAHAWTGSPAIVSLAGESSRTPPTARRVAPVAVLQVQGTADDTIHYDGGTIEGTAATGSSDGVVPLRRVATAAHLGDV